MVLSVLQREQLNKIKADLSDKVKDHPLQVRSLELSSKSRENVHWVFFVKCHLVNFSFIYAVVFVRQCGWQLLCVCLIWMLSAYHQLTHTHLSVCNERECKTKTPSDPRIKTGKILFQDISRLIRYKGFKTIDKTVLLTLLTFKTLILSYICRETISNSDFIKKKTKFETQEMSRNYRHRCP